MPNNPTNSVIINRIHPSVTKNEIYDSLLHFGPICYVDLSLANCRAFVDFADVDSATRCVNTARADHINLGGRQVFVDYSDRYLNNRKHTCSVVSMEITNVKYNIDVNVIREICKGLGKIVRIAIFKNKDVRAFIEFKNSNDAEHVVKDLDDCDIYEGCCSLSVSLTKSKHVTLFRNDEYNYETEPDAMEELPPQRHREGRSQYSYDRPPKMSRFDNGEPWFGYGMANQSPLPEKKDNYHHDVYHQPNSYSSYPEWNEEEKYERSFDAEIKGNVLSAYGFDPAVWNPHKIFNILCCYGNVLRIKFLLFKSECTLIEMSDNASAVRVSQKLSGLVIFGRSLMFSNFRQSFIEPVARPFTLPDGSSAFVDFSSDRNNRFTTPALASKNKMTSPDRSLHFFSGPPHYSDEDVCKIFVDCGAVMPRRARVFPSKDNNANTNGIVEFETVSQAAEALALTNHYNINHPGSRFNYIFKLCFSTASIL